MMLNHFGLGFLVGAMIGSVIVVVYCLWEVHDNKKGLR